MAEMKAIDCECDREREQARTPEQGPEKELPILDAFNAANPKLVNGSAQSQDILRLQLESNFGRLILAAEMSKRARNKIWAHRFVPGFFGSLHAKAPNPSTG